MLLKNDSASGSGWELDGELHAPSALPWPLGKLQAFSLQVEY